MSENLMNVYGYNRAKHTIPAKTLYTIDFEGNKPNYYRVNNMSDVTIYFSTQNIPNEHLYDFKATPSSIAPFAEPVKRDRLYCYNPSNVDVDIIILFWSGEFDPTFLALSNLSISQDGTIKTDGQINSINCPLPSGSNLIGRVQMDEETQEIFQTVGINLGTHGVVTNLIRNIKSQLDNNDDILNSVNLTADRVMRVNDYLKELLPEIWRVNDLNSDALTSLHANLTNITTLEEISHISSEIETKISKNGLVIWKAITPQTSKREKINLIKWDNYYSFSGSVSDARLIITYEDEDGATRTHTFYLEHRPKGFHIIPNNYKVTDIKIQIYGETETNHLHEYTLNLEICSVSNYLTELTNAISTTNTLLESIKQNTSGGGGLGVLVNIGEGKYEATEGYYVYKIVGQNYADSKYTVTLNVDGEEVTTRLTREEFNNLSTDLKVSSLTVASGNSATIIIKEL